MNKQEKIDFVTETTAATCKKLVDDINNDKLPENWEGMELRQLIADRIAWHTIPAKRLHAYNNECLIRDL